MSIHFISGKPGGGKTLYSMRLIADEIVFGNRPVITNVAIKLGELNAYLQQEYPKRSVDVINRVMVLTDEQAQVFWTIRPHGVRIKKLSKHEWDEGLKPNYSTAEDNGVFYAIDEIHNFFGARQWADTGRDVLFYLSQHRKLGDTVICITQAIGNVDKQFRSVAQDYTYIRNLSKERYGIFKMPAFFVRKTFSSPPTETSQPMETGTFSLDVSGLAACYDSAAGVGIHGKMADRNERTKGIPWVWFLVALAIIICAIFYGIPRAAAALFKTKLPEQKQVLSSPKATNEPATTVEPPNMRKGRQVPPPPKVEKVEDSQAVVGFAPYHNTRAVLLKDGRIICFGDPRWTLSTPYYVVVEGKTNYVRW